MTSAPLPPHEEARLSLLRDYQILDTPPEQSFDDVVQLAALVCGTPIALVSLVDDTRQWFKAKLGLATSSTPRDVAFCAHAILDSALLEVQDARRDPRFADNPLVTGEPYIRFYAGAPLVTPHGHRLGTICVVDQEPRLLEPAQRRALEALSRIVVGHLEARQVAGHLSEALVELELIYRHAPIGLCVLDRGFRFTRMNQRLADMHGVPVAGLLGRTVRDALPDLADALEPVFQRVFDTGEPLYGFEIRGQTSREPGVEGDWRTSSAPVRGKDGDVLGLACVVEEITAHKEAERALLHSERRFRALVEASAHIVWTAGTDGEVLEDSPSWRAFTGQTFEQSRGWGWLDVLHPDDRDRAADVWKRSLASKTPIAFEYRLRHVSGEWRWLAVRAVALNNADGSSGGWIGMNTDITERRREAEALDHRATHDALTGLVNRTELERRLQRVLTGAEMRDPHALLFLDLDQFKLVNDTCGHVAGDALLRQLPRVLSAPLRRRDTLARLGGDEFGILLEHCPEVDALRVARQLVEAVRGLGFVWEDKSFALSASIGLVAIPAGGDTLAEVMSAADRACYAAKEKGRNRVHVYAATDEELMQRRGEMQWVPRLHRALTEDRFRLYGQPIVMLKDHGHAVEYHEVLLRLVDERGALLLPGAFIPAAERYQQMRALDRWVVRTALSHLATREPPVRYGLNVSTQSLCDPSFLGFVLEQLDAAQVIPERVYFEITETAALTDLPHALRFMQTLKERGSRFALDDLGSGLASLSYLKVLPVDYLKIDGHFVRRLADDKFDHAVVRAIKDIAQSLGLQSIAESVESEATLERVNAMGIDFGQGYVFAEPRPLWPNA